MTHINHDHDGHSNENMKKLMPNVQLSSFNIVEYISPSSSMFVAVWLWPSWSLFVAVIVEALVYRHIHLYIEIIC